MDTNKLQCYAVTPSNSKRTSTRFNSSQHWTAAPVPSEEQGVECRQSARCRSVSEPLASCRCAKVKERLPAKLWLSFSADMLGMRRHLNALFLKISFFKSFFIMVRYRNQITCKCPLALSAQYTDHRNCTAYVPFKWLNTSTHWPRDSSQCPLKTPSSPHTMHMTVSGTISLPNSYTFIKSSSCKAKTFYFPHSWLAFRRTADMATAGRHTTRVTGSIGHTIRVNWTHNKGQRVNRTHNKGQRAMDTQQGSEGHGHKAGRTPGWKPPSEDLEHGLRVYRCITIIP